MMRNSYPFSLFKLGKAKDRDTVSSDFEATYLVTKYFNNIFGQVE